MQAVDGVSFSVTKGEMVGFLGPNGAGKTTTIKAILGLIRPDSGTVLVDGIDPGKNHREAANRMAAVLEGARNTYWRVSVWDNIQFFAGIHGVCPKKERDYLEHIMEILNLTDRRDTQVGNLSSGYKQKTALACALVKKTPLVFLDEPTLGLDVEASQELRAALKSMHREEKRTIIVSSHDMKVIQDICQRAIIICRGKTVADESIQNLLELFRTRSYTIIVPLGGHSGDPSALASRIEATFEGADVRTQRDALEITVDFRDPLQVYELTDVLRESGLPLESLSQGQVDLERVFLEIVRKENGRVVHSV